MNSSKKIVLLGYFGVGKTSLLRRFVDNQFSEDYIVTIGVHVKKKVITLENDKSISLIIWDLEGSRSIENTRQSYLLGASSFIYVFDVNNEETYRNLKSEKKYLISKFPKALIKAIGNKKDLIDEEEFKKEVLRLNLPVDILTSAKTGENIEGLFEDLAQELDL